MKRPTSVCATRPTVGIPLSMICGSTGPCTSVMQHHRLAAAAGGVGRFEKVIDSAQVIGQRLAARLRLSPGRGRPVGGLVLTLQRGEVCGQVCFVLGCSGLEHLALLGVQLLRVGTKLPRLQSREFERDLLELGVLEADGPRVAPAFWVRTFSPARGAPSAVLESQSQSGDVFVAQRCAFVLKALNLITA